MEEAVKILFEATLAQEQKRKNKNMSNIDELIKEGEKQLKRYEDTKESMLSNPEIPDIIKEIHVGLGEALRPTLKILYEQKSTPIREVRDSREEKRQYISESGIVVREMDDGGYESEFGAQCYQYS